MTLARALVAFALLLSCAFAAVELERRKPRPGGGGQCPPCPQGSQGQAPAPGKLDFYFLVRQWPYTFCTFKHCSKAPDQNYGFTLHGLWPNLDNHCQDDFPETCSHSRYDATQVDQNVLDDMEVMWTSYISDDDCFLNHEWQCHGTCSKQTQSDYFSNVIQLHKEHNIAAALKKSGIVPSDQPVSSVKFSQALKKAFGYAPILHCHNDKQSGNSYIDEIWQCVDKNTLKVMDCDTACKVPTSCAVHGRQQCEDDIIYDTPDIDLYDAPSGCTLHCSQKSGTCGTPALDLQQEA